MEILYIIAAILLVLVIGWYLTKPPKCGLCGHSLLEDSYCPKCDEDYIDELHSN